MKKSAASHGGVAVTSMVFGSIMTEILRPGFPGLDRFFESFGLGLSDLINSILNIHTDAAAFKPIIIGLLIGVVWGMIYGLARHRTNP